MSDTPVTATDTPTLPPHVREELDKWVARFPEGRERSAIIAGLHAAQHENHGFLTPDLMDGVAAYLDVPKIQVYEIATWLEPSKSLRLRLASTATY